MGVSSFIGNTFIVRSNKGKRVSCGVLKGDMKNAFVLIDPKRDQSLGELGTVVNYTSLKTKSNLLNIEAKFIKPYKSVCVTFDNPKRSDERGNFHSEAIPLRSHVVTAIPYVGNKCNGSPGDKLLQTFVVVLGQALTKLPTKQPTKAPIKLPTEAPTKQPMKAPTKQPTNTPTNRPTKFPTRLPIKAPTKQSTKAPTKVPIKAPTKQPTKSPTKLPSESPKATNKAPNEASNDTIIKGSYKTTNQITY